VTRSGYDRVKRLIDATGAATALILLSPVLLLVAALVAATLGRPVLFRQVRPGRYGRLFPLLKFRTMRPVDPSAGPVADTAALASDGDRLTAVGRFLRSASLDELPTLWNVLRGQMSFVGPRPLLVDYLDRYSTFEARRHEVRPGVTGLAQVRGRNALTWEQRFRYDVWYVDHRCLALDLRILAETVGAVLSRDGICAQGSPTALEFTGSLSGPRR